MIPFIALTLIRLAMRILRLVQWLVQTYELEIPEDTK